MRPASPGRVVLGPAAARRAFAAPGLLATWIAQARRPLRLVVSASTIRLWRDGTSQPGPVLMREHGDHLVIELGGTARSPLWVLTNPTGNPRLALQFFNREDVERACREAGCHIAARSTGPR